MDLFERREVVRAAAAEHGIDMGWVLIDAVGNVQIGMSGDDVDTTVEQHEYGLWVVFRHGQQTCVTGHFEVALVFAFRPLAAEGLFTISPASV